MCSSNVPVDRNTISGTSSDASCCGTPNETAVPASRGLATGVAGGLLSAPGPGVDPVNRTLIAANIVGNMPWTVER